MIVQEISSFRVLFFFIKKQKESFCENDTRIAFLKNAC